MAAHPTVGFSGLISRLISFYILKRDIINLNITFLFEFFFNLLRLVWLKEMKDNTIFTCFAKTILCAVTEFCPGRHMVPTQTPNI